MMTTAASGRIVVVVVVLVLGILAAALGMSTGTHTVRFTDDGRVAFGEEKAYWLERITAVGGRDAYREFAVSVETLPPKRAHIAAHVFGEALFEAGGFKSISICDARYAMGCLHAFFGNAAVDLGIDGFVESAGAACVQEPTLGLQRLCLHGAGHGLVGVLGYELDDLKKALSLCEAMPDAGNLTTGCWGGAFMEYNVRTLLSLETPDRPYTESGAYAPCDILAEKYAEPCMFWQPTWWDVVFSRNDDEFVAYDHIGALCAAHPNAKLAQRCFQGAGFRAAWISAYDTEAVARLCAAVSPELSNRLLCWDAAKSNMPSQSWDAVESDICSGLDGVQRQDCMTRVRR